MWPVACSRLAALNFAAFPASSLSDESLAIDELLTLIAR